MCLFVSFPSMGVVTSVRSQRALRALSTPRHAIRWSTSVASTSHLALAAWRAVSTPRLSSSPLGEEAAAEARGVWTPTVGCGGGPTPKP